MTNPTNWPNPERPGVPLFPERDGWHWLSDKEGGGIYSCKWFVVPENIYGGFWDCSGKRVFPYIMARTDNYLGICLTPTQIAEMLAGERERCAKLCEDAYEKSGHDFEYLACNGIAQQIRNLGGAP